MKNVISFENFLDDIILESKIIISQRNPEKEMYNNFSNDLLSKIGNINDKRCVVINDKDLAEKLSVNNYVLYIYYNEDGKSNNSKINQFYFDVTFNGKKINKESINKFKIEINTISKQNKFFDFIFNISLPIYTDGKYGHEYDYENVAYLNSFIFNTFIMDNDKQGVDRTMFFSLDDKDVYELFNKYINKEISKFGGKEIQPEVIGNKISSSKLDLYGFDDIEDKILSKIFIHTVDFIDELSVEDMDKEEENDDLDETTVIKGRKYPTIYCFTIPELPYALKVGETFRPVSVRMNEWKTKAFNNLKPQKHWSATVNGWVFEDHLVHEYLIDNGEKRLTIDEFRKVGFPDKSYSREFFKKDGILKGEGLISDVELAINQIKSKIKSNYESLIDKLKRSSSRVEESEYFYDERGTSKRDCR